MKKLLFIALMALGWPAVGQQDPEAKKLLDKVSEATKSNENIALDFSVTLENKSANIPASTMSGKILISGEKYRLELEGNEQISNGERIWRVLRDDEVVETMSVDDLEEEGLTPSRLLTMYESGFKYKMGDRKAHRMHEVQLIYLFPEDASSAPYTSIELAIDVQTNQIVYLMEKGKDGTITTYEIVTFRTNVDAPDGAFAFDKTKYLGFEIIDVGF